MLSVGAVLLLAELGDKTMLATVTLATTNGAWGTWAGSTLGMVAAFFVFGALLLIDAA